jgi:hypothetical protein
MTKVPRVTPAGLLLALAPLVTLAGLLLVLAPPVLAEEAADDTLEVGEWGVTSDLNITLTQNAYSDNWAGSELGAISWALNSNSLAENQLSEWLHSKNTLKLAFGQTHSQRVDEDDGEKYWDEPSKSTDLVDFESVFRLTHGWFVDPFVAARLKTQFLDETDAAKTRYLNPMVLTESFGVAKVLIKEEKREWTTRLGGALRQRIDRDALVEPPDTRETATVTDGGVEFVTEFRTPLAEERITFTSRLQAYKALYSSEEDDAATDDWQAPDVDWENTFTASITEYLMVNLYLQLLYDKEVVDDVRLKETLSFGFTFKFL